jgi:hypothetical protein
MGWARGVSDDDHDSQPIVHDHKASTAQQANLSTLYVSLKRLHAHVMLLRRVNACDLTNLGGHDCKVYTSGFMKAVAAAVHELENNACVHLVAAPAQRLHPPPRPLAARSISEPATCCEYQRREAPWSRTWCTLHAFAAAVASTYLQNTRIGQRIAQRKGRSGAALLRTQTSLVDVFGKSRDNNLRGFTRWCGNAAAHASRIVPLVSNR